MTTLQPNTLLLVAIAVIGGAVLLFLIARFARQIALAAVGLAALGVVALLAWAVAGQARATEQIAQVSTSANWGLTALIVLLLVVFLTAAVAIGYLYLRLRRAERRATRPSGGWLPGPNARWGQVNPHNQPQVADIGASIDRLILLQLLNELRLHVPATRRLTWDDDPAALAIPACLHRQAGDESDWERYFQGDAW